MNKLRNIPKIRINSKTVRKIAAIAIALLHIVIDFWLRSSDNYDNGGYDDWE